LKTIEHSLVRCLATDALHLILLGHMEPHVVRGVKNLLTDRVEELSKLSLSWRGCEARLAPDVVEDVLQHVGRLRRRNPGLAFASDVSTGGHLLDLATFDRLLSAGVTRFHVSFDRDVELSVQGDGDGRGPEPVDQDAHQAGSFVVRSDGRVLVCTALRDHARNQNGRLLESGRLEFDA